MNKLESLWVAVVFLIKLKLYEGPKEKMVGLKRKVEALESREADIIRQLDDEESLPRKKRKKSVENWLTCVGELKTQAMELDHKVQQGSLYNHPFLLSEIRRATTYATELCDQLLPDMLTFEARGSQGLEFPTTELVGKTSHANKNMILDILTNGVSCVGIFGMGGIGKTMLITHLHNELVKKPNVSVFFVTVSKDFTIEKLQSDIAKALSVDLGDENEEKNKAAKIAHALKKRRDDVVLILDDLWTGFQLEDIGICVGSKLKVIFATRSLDVCNRMGCETVELSLLEDVEAWALFRTTLGHNMKLTPQLEEIAKRVMKECAGLPLGIEAMAMKMRGVEDEREWIGALDAMRSHQAEAQDQDEEGLKKVFAVLKYSYDALDVMTQECFLFCALFPKDRKIRREHVIRYFINVGLIQGMSDKEAFNDGHRVLSRLARVCLLQGRPNWKYLRMHDLVREMAKRIAKKKHPFLVEDNLHMLNGEKWQAEWVAFIARYLPNSLSSALPPECPKISMFFLRECYNVTTLPDPYFDHMETLKILDLSRTGLSHLPSSISNLKGLTALLLGSCRKIEHLVPLENLTALERLDLSGTGISELPSGIEMLTDLRELNLHDAKRLRMIPDGVLCKLTRLQRLLLPKLKIGSGLAEEIASLQALAGFKVEYYNTNDLNAILKSWRSSNPDEYKLLGAKILCRDLNDVDEEEKKVVSITKCHDLGTLCELGSLKNARDLRTCYVGECDRMVHLFSQDCFFRPFFRSLKIICLESLLSLRELIGQGRCGSSPMSHWKQQKPGSFSCLRRFSIYNCPKIDNLFTPALLPDLQNLETLKVCECVSVVEIVQDQEEDYTKMNNFIEINSFPKLKQFKLRDLPKLKGFCGSRKLVSSSLEQLDIADCPKLESLPLVPTTSNFCSLKELTIKRCSGIKILFTLAMPLNLINLEILFIHGCEELAEIVQALNRTDQAINGFPKLKVLKMQSLPRLECFSQCTKLVSDSVEEISIINCPNLKRFPLLRDELKHPMSLKRLTVEEEWWEAIDFEHPSTKDLLKPMCDFRHRFNGHVSHLN